MSVFFHLLPALAFAQVSQSTMDDTQPQWEVGVGAINLNIPDYPGSANNRYRLVPFPYGIYRGEFIRSDDEGTRARLLSSKRHEIGFSFSFNFPVNSGDNPVRQGMPDLDSIYAFGPQFLFRFITDSPRHKLNFTLSARAAFSTKLSFNNLARHEGFSYEPRFNYWYRWLESKTTFFTALSAEFGSAKYNSFFYNVSRDYTTADRPQYLAKEGLIETSFLLGFGQEISKDFFIFGGGSWRNLELSANKESPLLARKDNLGFLIGLVWTLFESEEKVKRI